MENMDHIARWAREDNEKLDELTASPVERGVVCECGNPRWGFDCVCEWVKQNPGTQYYDCEYCGIYQASGPRCNKCEAGSPYDWEA